MDLDFGGNTLRGLAAPGQSDQPARRADTDSLAQPRPIDISGAVTETVGQRVATGAAYTLTWASFQPVLINASAVTLTLPTVAPSGYKAVSFIVDLLMDGGSSHAVTFAAPAGTTLVLHQNAQPAVNGAAGKLSMVHCIYRTEGSIWTVGLSLRQG